MSSRFIIPMKKNFFLIILLGAITPVVAWGEPNQITKPSFKETRDHLLFTFVFAEPIDRSQVKVQTNASLLKIEFSNIGSPSRWLKSRPEARKDPLIEGILLRPVPSKKGTAELRIRFRTTVSQRVKDGVALRFNDKQLSIRVPKSKKVAQIRIESPIKQLKRVKPLPLPMPAAKRTPPLKLEPVTPTAPIEPTGTGTKWPAPRPEPLSRPSADPPMVLNPSTTMPQAPPTRPLSSPSLAEKSRRVGSPEVKRSEPSRPSPAVDMGTPQAPQIDDDFIHFLLLGGAILLFAVAALFWRKARVQQRLSSHEPNIRILGTKMVTPKQRLILVEVLDQLLLVGSSDQGLCMISRIDQRDEQAAAPAPLHASVHPIRPISHGIPAGPEIDHGHHASFPRPVESDRHAVPAMPSERTPIAPAAPLHATAEHAPPLEHEGVDSSELQPLIDEIQDRSYSSASTVSAPQINPSEEVNADDLLEKIRQLQRN